jgi:hypothetical protein
LRQRKSQKRAHRAPIARRHVDPIRDCGSFIANGHAGDSRHDRREPGRIRVDTEIDDARRTLDESAEFILIGSGGWTDQAGKDGVNHQRVQYPIETVRQLRDVVGAGAETSGELPRFIRVDRDCWHQAPCSASANARPPENVTLLFVKLRIVR